MALDIVLTTNRIASDPTARDIIEHLRQNAAKLKLDDAVLYYDFPGYPDYETVYHKPDALVVSPRHGVLALRFLAGSLRQPAVAEIDASLGEFCSMLIGRLLKSRSLRKTTAALAFDVQPVLVALSPHAQLPPRPDAEASVVSSIASLDQLLVDSATARLSPAQLEETRSIIEGAKALARPQRRVVSDAAAQPMAAALHKLELEITNFDQQQRRAALNMVPGPQRIRGLAGSGKTVILAMKAAQLHAEDDSKKILVTFSTKSLRATLENLIDRFFKHNSDKSPSWGSIDILHGWGSASVPGVYSEACKRSRMSPHTVRSAMQGAKGKDALGFVCRELLKTGVEPYYDHILIDEGQDFSNGFYELCFALAKGDRDRKSIVWTYDELQNIFNVRVPSPEQLFGKDNDGKPRISLERAAQHIPFGNTNDTVLSKCYRNQREVLVTAHALGFGIYHDIVQLLESREHWKDVGYQVVAPDRKFRIGDQVLIRRPEENSPLAIDGRGIPPLIDCCAAADLGTELDWVTAEINRFLAGGLEPHEILVINLDDLHTKTMLRELAQRLAGHGIEVNNVSDDWGVPAFTTPGKITLSTVYKAKGNEASAAFVIGVDGIDRRLRADRNKLFTAFTRTKAWLRVSGVAPRAKSILAEIDAARAKFPNLEFKMPDLSKVDLIQRDLSDQAIQDQASREEIVKMLKTRNYSDERIDNFLLDWRRGRAPEAE